MKILAFGLGLRCWTNGDGGALKPLLRIQYLLPYNFCGGGGKSLKLTFCLLIVVSCCTMELSP